MRLFELANNVLLISMKNYEIKTEIQLTSPPSKVWSALVDFDHWKDWNPAMLDLMNLALKKQVE